MANSDSASINIYLFLVGYLDRLRGLRSALVLIFEYDSSLPGRKSTDHWEYALRLAQACFEKFNEPVTSLENIEKNLNGKFVGNDALTFLF